MTIVDLGVMALTVGVIAALVVDRYVETATTVSSDDERTRRDERSRSAGPIARGDHLTTSGFSYGPALLLCGLVVGLVFLVVGQVGLIGGDPSRRSLLLWFAGLATLVAVEWRSATPRVPADLGRVEPRASTSDARWRFALLVPVLLASAYILVETPSRKIDDPGLDIVVLWVLSIAALVVASGAWLDARPSSSADSSGLVDRQGVGLIIVLLLVAAVPRVYSLSSYAWSMSGDEGTFAVAARSTLEGAIRNPFSSGPWGYPSLLFIVQGWLIDLFGGGVGSARVLSATFGIGSVMAVWLLVRHHFGRHPALLAALICATFSYHVYWSRDAQNASAPMFFLPLAIYFLDRGVIGGSRAFSVAAGLTIAFAQFFHPSNRLLIPIALAYVLYALVLRTRDAREASRRSWGPILANAGWMSAAIVIGHLPLIGYFEANRVEFWSRINEVSVFASGWLDREKIITGDSALQILSRQVWNAIMLPFSTMPHGHFRPGSPLVGWPLVIFVAIGLALATAGFLRRRYFGIALAFWMVTVGLAFTEGPPMTNRYTAAAPFLAILGALGLWTIAGLVVRLGRLPSRAAMPAAVLVAVLISAWHIHFYFRHPNQVDLYSDANSQIANGIAREAEAMGDGTIVYLAGAPRLLYSGFMNIPFIAPKATGIDVDPPWSAGRLPPRITGPTLFAFIPARLAEVENVRAWFPRGTRRDYFLPNGKPLYTSFRVDPDNGLPPDR